MVCTSSQPIRCSHLITGPRLLSIAMDTSSFTAPLRVSRAVLLTDRSLKQDESPGVRQWGRGRILFIVLFSLLCLYTLLNLHCIKGTSNKQPKLINRPVHACKQTTVPNSDVLCFNYCMGKHRKRDNMTSCLHCVKFSCV